MPIYEYEREDGSRFEFWQKINDEPLDRCPETNQKVRRLVSLPGKPVFKGSGFYETDYKKKK